MGLTIFSNQQGLVSSFVNPSRYIKFVFLSFAQQLFTNYAEFLWTSDRTTTTVIIQDKWSEAVINNEKIPQIIFNRGAINFLKTSIDQSVNSNVNIDYPKNMADVIRTSGSFSCIAQDQVTSEHIADILGTGIFTFRELFNAKYVKIAAVEVGESNPIKMQISGNKVDMFNTPVFVSFDTLYTYTKNADFTGVTANYVDLTISGFPDPTFGSTIGTSVP